MSTDKLNTMEIALFQLLEQGFAGVVNGITLLRAKNAVAIEAQNIQSMIQDLQERSEEEEYTDTGEALEILGICQQFFAERFAETDCAVLVAYKPSVEEGMSIMRPVARLLMDPTEVIEPDLQNTDGAGNVKEDSGNDDQAGNASGSGSNKSYH
jgi:hypothetical protein